MKTRDLIIIGMILLPISIGSVYAECSEQDRDACFDADGKFDYDAYEDSFWEPIEIDHIFEKNSTVTFEHKKEGLGLRGWFNATQEDMITMIVPRNIADSMNRNCDPDEMMLLAKYDVKYDDTTFHDGFYQTDIMSEQIMNQTNRKISFKVLPSMSFELHGAFPLGLIEEMFATCGAPNGYLTYYAPPKFQLENNVAFEDIKCNYDFDLILRPDQSGAACVRDETVEKLERRNWIASPYSKEILGVPK
jgi:hypothetical protein